MSHPERRNEGEAKKKKKPKRHKPSPRVRRRRWGLPAWLLGGQLRGLTPFWPRGSRVPLSPGRGAVHCAGLRGALAAIVREGFGILCFLKLQF